MNIILHKATDQDLPIAKNLVPYYIYDMSEYLGWPCTAEGRFGGCDDFESYWQNAGRHAFILRAAGELVGFALIRADHDEPDLDYSVGEFFVLRKFRGQGVGEKIARQLFDRFRGQWEVSQLATNQPALAFWRKVISRYSDSNFKEEKEESPWGQMNVIRFGNN